MKKVFIIHGFEGSPNGGWRPWLMGELARLNIYACALSMPSPDSPICDEWIEEISRHVERNSADEIYLVGHSLGVVAILRYLEDAPQKTNVAGALLVSGPAEMGGSEKMANFFDKPFDFEKINRKVSKFAVIHGDDDPNVPLNNAEFLAKKLNCELVVVPGGMHLNGSAGWFRLPPAIGELKKMFGLDPHA